MEDILTSIGDSFDKLRKADGTKYKGDRTKAVNGALYSTGVFRRVNDKWSLRPAEYQVYESRMRQKLEHRGKKRRISGMCWRNL
jgi:singapore isolate B (sub-type 7) whole genome shotgun sequence assembly, scaffold_5